MKPIFYDPGRKRWKRLRRVLDGVAVLSTIILVLFAISVARKAPLPGLPFPSAPHKYRVYAPRHAAHIRPARKHRLHERLSSLVLNQDEGVRAAFYTNDEPSYASLKAHVRQIDLLFPDWLHIVGSDGHLKAITNLYPAHFYDVVDPAGVHGIDPGNRVAHAIGKEDVSILPMLNNFNALTNKWDGAAVGAILANPASAHRLHVDLDKLLWANPKYRGITMDFEEVPDSAMAAYAEWLYAVHRDFTAKGLKIYVNVPARAAPATLRAMGQATDGVILMNYDQHEETSAPGPIAGEEWFENNLARALKYVPKEKLLCAIGNYGYDWQQPIDDSGALTSTKVEGADDLTVQEAWDRAEDAGASVTLAGDELNPYFAYDDDDEHVRHKVWFLDGVSALNELRAARQMGLKTFALWRLGSEDDSLWSIWDHPSEAGAPAKVGECSARLECGRGGRGRHPAYHFNAQARPTLGANGCSAVHRHR